MVLYLHGNALHGAGPEEAMVIPDRSFAAAIPRWGSPMHSFMEDFEELMRKISGDFLHALFLRKTLAKFF
jgi:hypothetical protein